MGKGRAAADLLGGGFELGLVVMWAVLTQTD